MGLRGARACRRGVRVTSGGLQPYHLSTVFVFFLVCHSGQKYKKRLYVNVNAQRLLHARPEWWHSTAATGAACPNLTVGSLVCFPGLLVGRILFIGSRKETHPTIGEKMKGGFVCVQMMLARGKRETGGTAREKGR